MEYRHIFTLLISNLLMSAICEREYTNIWTVKINGTAEDAKKIAKDYEIIYLNEFTPNIHAFKKSSIRKRSLRPDYRLQNLLIHDKKVIWAEQERLYKRVVRDTSYFNDPLWPSTWYLIGNANHDLNVMEVYKKYNITGAGIHVSVIDDGLERDHPDLKQNYDAEGSYDIRDDDDDPSPSGNHDHGTQCAGVIAATADNRLCGVGIAFNSRIGGLRILEGGGGGASGYAEERAVMYKKDYIDIKSMSWGPADEADNIEGPIPSVEEAFAEACKLGRNNLGTIFVLSSGNGGDKGDSCAFDGYNNLIHTISIAAASQQNTSPHYAEQCSAIMATTYSSSRGGRSVISSTIHGQCTTGFSGTSAAAPMAAGIIALTLEANKKLSWRDVQYIIFLTAKRNKLQASDWSPNGFKREVSHHFGFGLMDALAMVRWAKHWTAPAEQHICQAVLMDGIDRSMSEYTSVQYNITTDGCKNAVKYLEHVVSIFTFYLTSRGQFEVFLTSPSGTVSKLLFRRPSDTKSDLIPKWKVLSVHFWGEDPNGQWSLNIKNFGTTNTFKYWSLIFYGVDTKPQVYDKPLPEEDSFTEETESETPEKSKSTEQTRRPTNGSNYKEYDEDEDDEEGEDDDENEDDEEDEDDITTLKPAMDDSSTTTLKKAALDHSVLKSKKPSTQPAINNKTAISNKQAKPTIRVNLNITRASVKKPANTLKINQTSENKISVNAGHLERANILFLIIALIIKI